MELKYNIKEWGDLTLAMSDEIDAISGEDISEAEKDIKVMALLCDVDEDEIWSLPIEEVRRLRTSLLSIGQGVKRTRSQISSKMVINGKECDIKKDVTKWTYAQYVDFQNYWKDLKKKKGEILSTFILPKGMKYNDGYDLVQWIDELYHTITVSQFNDIMFFFAQRLEDLMRRTQVSLEFLLGMETMKTKNKKEREILRQMKEKVHLLGSHF